MYTISDEVWKAYVQAQRALVPEEAKVNTDPVIPDDILTTAFRDRMLGIYERVQKISGIYKILKFMGGKGAHSKPIADEESIYFGVLYSTLPDGAVAAVLAHELAHFQLNSMKRHAEQMMEAAYISGTPATVEEFFADIASIGPFVRELASLKIATGEAYIEGEMDADRLGVDWALQAGFDPDEVRRLTDIFRDEGNKARNPQIEQMVDRFKLTGSSAL